MQILNKLNNNNAISSTKNDNPQGSNTKKPVTTDKKQQEQKKSSDREVKKENARNDKEHKAFSEKATVHHLNFHPPCPHQVQVFLQRYSYNC